MKLKKVCILTANKGIHNADTNFLTFMSWDTTQKYKIATCIFPKNPVELTITMSVDMLGKMYSAAYQGKEQ